jgi:hypothetical protein
VTFAKMDKCPRCSLPQKGIYRCQYCGYDLKKYNKRPATIIRKRFKDSIIAIKQSRIFSSNKKSRGLSMNNVRRAFKRKDSLENRSGAERRKHRYATYYPERRSGVDRRK